MIELRHLNYLLAACEHGNFARASHALTVAPSTLSASLKVLETEFGHVLFRRLGSGLYPRTCARWLVRAGLPLLLLERHARRRLRAVGEARTLRVEVELKFTIGRVTKALLRAIAETEAEDPLLLVHPVWIDDEPSPFDNGWPEAIDLAPAGTVGLRMTEGDGPPSGSNQVLIRDPWVLAYRTSGDEAVPPDLAARTIMIPLVSRGMSSVLQAHLVRSGLRDWRFVHDHPGSLPRIMNAHPEVAFLVPQSTLGDRLGLGNVATAALKPSFTSALVAHGTDGGPAVEAFLERLRRALGETDRTTDFVPELTSRRLRYFTLADRLRSVSAAARVANVAQSALSGQLRKLEATLGARLFDRHSGGVAPTLQSIRFSPAATMLEQGLGQLKIAAMSSFSGEDERVNIGVLPSVSQHGLLIDRIARALLALKEDHPHTRVTIQEGLNETLQDWVLRGQVGLAILETGPPRLPRLPLGASENLAVIVDARHDILPEGSVRFADLQRLQLVLPTVRSGLRQLLDATARGQGVELRPAMEIDALAMLIVCLRHQAIHTILPASAVRRELESRELSAHLIIDPAVARRLFAVYSGDRSLSKPERRFIALLRDGLSRRDVDAGLSPERADGATPEWNDGARRAGPLASDDMRKWVPHTRMHGIR